MGFRPTKGDEGPLDDARGSAWDAHCKQSRDRKGADAGRIILISIRSSKRADPGWYGSSARRVQWGIGWSAKESTLAFAARCQALAIVVPVRGGDRLNTLSQAAGIRQAVPKLAIQ